MSLSVSIASPSVALKLLRIFSTIGLAKVVMIPQKKVLPKDGRIVVLVNRQEVKRLKLVARAMNVSLGELVRSVLAKVK
jgi:hypothetical protein